MSNIAIAFPNRILEQKKLHYTLADWNTNLPIDNILTDVLPETARTETGVRTVNFGISLSNLPYRTLGAMALVNHSLSTSAKVRFCVFNEPPIDYGSNTIAFNATGNISIITDTVIVVTGWTTGTKIKLFPLPKSRTNKFTTSYIEGTFVSYTTGTKSLVITVTAIDHQAGDASAADRWYVGFGNQVGKTECAIHNVPTWVDCWQRIYLTNSPELSWRSRNFWRGTVELEIMELVTKIHISFLSDQYARQPLGTHLNIAIDDSSEPETWSDGTSNPNFKNHIELGRVFMGGYLMPNLNAEYGDISHGVVDNSDFQQSDSGQKFFHEKSRARTVAIQWNYFDKDEAMQMLLSQLQQGISREVLYTYSVDKIDSYQLLQSFVGRYKDLNPLTQPDFGRWGASINLEEIL
jgi:hypothetical protein